MSQPSFSPLTPAEIEWVALRLHEMKVLTEASSPADAGAPRSASLLDRVYAGWLERLGDEDPNPGINAFGAALGQLLVDELGWLIASDPQGAELAVLALPGQGDVLIYPQNFVAKRWARRELGFFQPFVEDVRRQLAQVANSWREPPAKPWWKLW